MPICPRYLNGKGCYERTNSVFTPVFGIILLFVLKWNERENAMGILPENIFVGEEKF